MCLGEYLRVSRVNLDDSCSDGPSAASLATFYTCLGRVYFKSLYLPKTKRAACTALIKRFSVKQL